MRYAAYGGVRVVGDDGADIRLGLRQRALLGLLLLRLGEVVSTTALIEHLWGDHLPANPANSLHDLVRRLRAALGDRGHRIIVFTGTGYAAMLDPDDVDVAVVRRLLEAGLTLETVEPALSRHLLVQGLAPTDGELPDIRPDHPLSADVYALEQLCRDARDALARLDATGASGAPAPVAAPPELRWSPDAAGLVLRIAELPPLVGADLVRALTRATGRVRGFSGGIVRSTFPGAASALVAAARVLPMLTREPEGLLGGAAGHIPEASARGFERLVRLAAHAAPRQVLVTAELAEAAAAARCEVDLERVDDELYELLPGPRPPATGAAPVADAPGAVTPLVGRGAELAAVERLAMEGPLVTLCGPGGIGKTRLACEIVRRIGSGFTDCPVVDLAGTDRHGGPLWRIAGELGVLPDPLRSLGATLVDRLGERHVLLTLDNCEPVADDVRWLCDELSATRPTTRVLATSRSPIGARAETVFEVDGLDPDDSTELLVRLAFGGRAPASDERHLVAKLCELAGGVPLALECVASLVRATGLEATTAALSSLPDGTVLPVLDAAQGGRGRYRSMEVCLSASYRHLDPDDAAFFERLSCLRGAFGADDALVAEPDPGVVEGRLRRLQEVALLRAESRGRWRMLEPVRQFGATLLVRRGDQARQAAHHAAYFVALAQRAEGNLRSPAEGAWFARISDGYPNLEAALSWALAAGEAPTALRLTTSLWWYWAARGMSVEGADALERALALPGDAPPAMRAQALVAVSHLAWWSGNPARTVTASREALELSTALDDDLGERERKTLAGWAHTGLAAARMWGGGDRAELEAHLEAGAALFREVDDRAGLGIALETHGGVAWHYGEPELALARTTGSLAAFTAAGHQTMIAQAMRSKGLAAALLGEVDEGRQLVVGGLALSEELGDAGGLPLGLCLLGYVEELAGRTDRAVAAFARSLAANRERGQPWAALLAVTFAGRHAVACGRPSEGLRLLAAGERLSRRTGIRVPPYEAVLAARAWEEALDRLDTVDREAAGVRASGLSAADAVRLAIRTL